MSPVFGLAVDLAGNLLIADSEANRIRRVAADGTIATIAGIGDCGLSGDGGPAVAAQLCGPTGIASDGTGNLFITDGDNNRIRQIKTNGTIATVAGKGLPDDAWPSGDGGAEASAGLYLPSNVAVDQAGNLYVADTFEGFVSGDQVVRKISPGGTVTTVAGLPCFDETPVSRRSAAPMEQPLPRPSWAARLAWQWTAPETCSSPIAPASESAESPRTERSSR